MQFSTSSNNSTNKDSPIMETIDWNLISQLDPKQIKSKKETDKINLIIKYIAKATIPDDPNIFSNHSLTPRLIELLQLSIQYLLSLHKKSVKTLTEKTDEYNKLRHKYKKVEGSYRQSLQIIDQLRIPRDICPLCGKKFKIGGYLDQHFRIKHPNLIEPWIQIRTKSNLNNQQDEQMLMNEIATIRQSKEKKEQNGSELIKSFGIEQGDIVQFSPTQPKSNAFPKPKAKDDLLNTNQIDQMADKISKRIAETIHSNQKTNQDEYDGNLKRPPSRVMFDQSVIQKQYQNVKTNNTNENDHDDYMMESGEIPRTNVQPFTTTKKQSSTKRKSKAQRTTEYPSDDSYESGEYIPIMTKSRQDKESCERQPKPYNTQYETCDRQHHNSQLESYEKQQDTYDKQSELSPSKQGGNLNEFDDYEFDQYIPQSNTQLESLPKPPKRAILPNSDNSSSDGFVKSNDEFDDYSPESKGSNNRQEKNYNEFRQNKRETDFTNTDLDELIPESSSIIEERREKERQRLVSNNFSSNTDNGYQDYNETEDNQQYIADNDFYVDDSFAADESNKDYRHCNSISYENVPPEYTHYTPDELEVLMAEDSALEDAVYRSPKNTRFSNQNDFDHGEELEMGNTVDEELNHLREMEIKQSAPVSTNQGPMTIAEAKKMARQKKGKPQVTTIGGIAFTDSELVGFL